MTGMRNANVKLIAVSIGFSLLSQPSHGAVPPSEATPASALWQKVGDAAEKNLLSGETGRLIEQFAKSFLSHEYAPRVDYIRGERLFAAGEFQKAAVAFERFSREHAGDELADSAQYRLGECYHNMGVYLSAQSAWEKLAANHHDSALYPAALENLAMLQMRAKEWGRADELFERLAREFPAMGRADRVRENRGVVKYFLGDYADSAAQLDSASSERGAFYRGLSLFALKLYEETAAALTGAPASGAPFAEQSAFLKAESFFQKMNYNLAATEYADFARRNPSSALVPFANARRAACALLVGERAEAVRLADAAATAGAPLDVRVNASFVKGVALNELNRFGEAVRVLSGVADRTEFPDLAAAALVRLAWAQKKSGNAAGMLASLRSLEERYPSSKQIPLARFLAGGQLYENEKWEDAAAKLETAVVGHAYTPLSEAALALMAVSLAKAGRTDQLMTSANAALKLFEKNFSPETGHWRGQSYFFVGKAFYDGGRHKDARPFFERLARRFPGHPLAVNAELMAAWCLAEAGDNEKARAKAQALADNPKLDKDLRAGASFLIASTHFNAKDYDKSLVAFADFLKAHPADGLAPRARYLSGLGYYQKKVFGSAIEEWQALIARHPADPLSQDAYLHIGDLYFRSGDNARAAGFLKAFREKWPSSKLARVAMWQELQAHFNAKNDEVLLSLYPAYLKSFPEAPNASDARNQEELVYYRRGAQGDPAKLEQFLSRYPTSPFAAAARFKLGDMAIEQKAWNRAISEMEQFVRDHADDKLLVDALYGLGVAYENANQPDKATVQYQHIIRTFASRPGAIDAAFRLGTLLFKRERYQEALETFRFASTRKLTPELAANVQFNIALAAENLGLFVESADAYATFARVTKDAVQRREALLSAGLLLKKAERHADAARHFRTVLKDPGTPEIEIQATTMLAETHRARGRDNDAIKVYERLIGAEPAGSDLRLAGLAQLAYLLEQKKDLRRAAQVYEKIAVSEGKAEWVNAARQRMDLIAKNINPAP